MLCTVKLEGGRVGFESPYSDEEAILALRAHIVARLDMRQFGRDLLRQLNRGNRLSRIQLDWVHWFALNPNE
jgi:hypothetical protein